MRERRRESERREKERVGWHTEVGTPIKDSSAAVWRAHQHVVFAATIINLSYTLCLMIIVKYIRFLHGDGECLRYEARRGPL